MNLRHSILLLLSVVLSGVAASAKSTCADEITIVAFGDSTTAPRSTVKKVYADRLVLLLKKKGVAAKVINAGVGGSHTGRLKDNARHRRRHALDRLDDAVRSHKPDIVVVQFGWNDSWIDSGKPEGPSRIPVEKYAANLKHIAETLTEDGSKVILMTPNRPNKAVEMWQFKRTQQYVEAVRKLAEKEAYPLVDIWKEYELIDALENRNADDLLLDNVHPNDKGHELVARLLSKLIAAHIKSGKTDPPKSHQAGGINLHSLLKSRPIRFYSVWSQFIRDSRFFAREPITTVAGNLK